MTTPTIEYPLEFPIKIMGYANASFQTTVLSIIRKHFPNYQKENLTIRHSKEEKYMSITVVVIAESRAQLDAIYLELTQSEEVLMAL